MSNTSEASARAYIRRESLNIYNRLHSIEADIAFVNEVRTAYPTFPLIPNLRCGAWYTDPTIAHPTAHAYFKSTDGHHGNWSFNLRRPNLHLVPLAAAHGGLILVDSTRAGKRLPDALSKTAPIWCAVVNRALRLRQRGLAAPHAVIPAGADDDDDAANLHTPPGAVSPQEHVQIAARLDGWAAGLADSSYALPALVRLLRPLWITPASSRFPHISPDAPFLPVICVSASRAAEDQGGSDVTVGRGRRAGGFSYVQGSGDDHELWGQGLTPRLFWLHRVGLLACPRDGLEALVARLVANARDAEQSAGGGESDGAAWRTLPTPVSKVRGRVLLCAVADLPRDLLSRIPGASDTHLRGETAFVIVDESDAPPDDTDNRLPPEVLRSIDGAARPDEAPGESGNSSDVLRVHLAPGKRGQHVFMHDVLPRVISFIGPHLGLGKTICVAGGDAGIGVALVLLQLFFDDDGRMCDGAHGGGAISKSSVRTRLEWIIADRPHTNPPRAILKWVNNFLLSPHWRGR
ncbi:initiator tRNA phosphoribosyl transferase-domain-containing protein [Lactifluus subvellereus]|nr:initiator tRNA phosphoribosyl transferase-domain-containing protein [Lactifluus subvellereus]